MKIPSTTTDYQTSLDTLREQRQVWYEYFLSGPGLIVGLTVFILIVMAAVVIPAIANVDLNAITIIGHLKGSNLKHPFDTDEFGRDLVIRVLYEVRVSLLAGGTVALLSRALSTVISVYASYFKIPGHILIHICEGLIVISDVLLTIALVVMLGAGNLSVIIALIIMYTPSAVRAIHSNTLVIKEQSYVEVAKVQGVGSGHILRKSILPGVTSFLTIQVSFTFTRAIISETSLGFLRVSIPAPAVGWSNILQGSKQALQKVPWTVIFPGLAAVLCVLGLNLLGNGLRDYLDPRTVGRKKQ